MDERKFVTFRTVKHHIAFHGETKTHATTFPYSCLNLTTGPDPFDFVTI